MRREGRRKVQWIPLQCACTYITQRILHTRPNLGGSPLRRREETRPLAYRHPNSYNTVFLNDHLQSSNIFLPTACGISWNSTASEVLRPSPADLEKAAPIARPSPIVCNAPLNNNMPTRALFVLGSGCSDWLWFSDVCSSCILSCTSVVEQCEWVWPPCKNEECVTVRMRDICSV